jgi:putative ABC transport system permease protein
VRGAGELFAGAAGGGGGSDGSFAKRVISDRQDRRDAMGWMVSRRRRHEELSESVREHLAERVDELVSEGEAREEAEFRARREFGNVALIEERSREVWQWPSVESLLADVKFALRQLMKAPGFTVTAVLTLALGIAVNATMFSMVSSFLMPRLPGREAENVLVVTSVNPGRNFMPDVYPVSVPNYLVWREDKRVFAEMAASTDDRTGSLSGAVRRGGPGSAADASSTSSGEGQAEAIQYESVSPNYFEIFGAVPELGRVFVAGEDQPGRDHEVVLGHGLWVRRFGSDAGVVGRTVRLNREDYTVVGVMGADFRLLGYTPQLWAPLTLTGSDTTPEARQHRLLFLFARAAAGVTLEQARTEMRVLAERAEQDYPGTEKRWGVAVRTLPDYLVHAFGIRQALAVIMTTVGFVLLIACANVAALFPTRAAGRQKELAIRAALGASRARVVRQLLTEGVVIALMGGGAGLLLTMVGIRVLQAGLRFNEATAAIPLALDGRVLVFAAAVSLLSALLSSLAPALKASRTQINTELKSEGRAMTAGRSHSRLRSMLVGGEIAMALFLLIGSSLLIRGVYMLDHQKLGFRQDHLLTAGVVLDAARYKVPAQQLEFAREVLPRLREIPGAEGAAVASSLPASGPGRVTIHIKGEPVVQSSEERTALDVVASADYFRVAGVTLERGRAFTDQDNADAPRAALVNEEFVRQYFAGRDPVGEQIELDKNWSEVVGVVNDVKAYSEETRGAPQVYETLLQRPVGSLSLMLRTNVEPNSLIPQLRSAVAGIDPELPLLQVMSMEHVIEVQRSGNPLFTKLLSLFATLALLLAAIGIYGLIAYSVGQRTQEIGIRLALGARGVDISRMILRQGLKVAAIGSAIGLVLAVPLPKLFDSIFLGISFGAVGVYPAVLMTMLVVVLLATWAPAVRATRVDPTRALRAE